MHRVVNRSATATRHSLVFFCNCDFDALVETIPTAAAAVRGVDGGGTEEQQGVAGARGSSGGMEGGGGGGGGKQYPPVKAGEYILQKLGLMYT